MSVLTGVGILLLSMLILLFLQLSPGIFMIFSHYASAKFSRHKTSDLALFYIIGVETIIALVFVILYYAIISISNFIFDFNIRLDMLTLIAAGVFSAIGIIIPIVYYKKATGTRLFISRKLANNLNYKARHIKNRSDAFVLGVISNIPEFIFTLPLYLLSITIIMEIGKTSIERSAIILLFMMLSILPLITIRLAFYNGLNLANLQRFREKNKTFVRFMLGLLYILIAIVLVLRVYG